VAGLLLIRGAKQLLTLRGPLGPRRGAALNDLGLIRDGALLVRDGIILEVGPSRRVENLAPARRAVEINAAGRVVMPGFVDSHTHLVHGGPWLEDFESRFRAGGPPEPSRALHASVQTIHSSSTQTLTTRAGRVAGMMLRHGTTSMEAKSGYGLDAAGELKVLRAVQGLNGNPLDIAATCLSSPALQEQSQANRWEYLLWTCTELLPQVQRRGLARFADIFCDRPGFSLEQTRHFLQIARSFGFELKMHADQFCDTGGAALAAQLRCVSADHLDHIGLDGIAAMARSETVATLLPGPAFHRGLDRYAPARALIDAGAAVSLATDYNPGTSPTCSMQTIVALACLGMQMSPAEAIAAATINGAHAMGCAARAGSLETGKQADVLLLNASDYREIPYRFGVNLAHTVIKKGAVVYREGEIQN
jgi:imidazolonepropionase